MQIQADIGISLGAEGAGDCPLKETLGEKIQHLAGFVPISRETALPDKMYDGFLLPIDYLDKTQVHIVPTEVASDVEFITTTAVPLDASSSAPYSSKSMYEYFCEPTTDFGRMLFPEFAKQYTTNADYLKDTQSILQSVVPAVQKNIHERGHSPELAGEMVNKFKSVWKDVKEDTMFLEKHGYMEYTLVESLNKSRQFLQIYSILNIASPIISLIMPLIFMLLPFALLKLWGIPIGFQKYWETLKDVSKHHFIGRVLNTQTRNIESVLYAFAMFGIYLFQTYTQITSCMRYHRIIQQMNEHILFLREYLEKTTHIMQTFSIQCNQLPYYQDMAHDINNHQLVLSAMLKDITDRGFTPYSWSVHKFGELGSMFELHYKLYSDMDYEESLRYSVGFWGYWDILCGIRRGIETGYLGVATFVSGDEKEHDTQFVDQYYPPHREFIVPNTVDLSRNMIITGVNASGKTTTLKTTMLNILFTQQFGVGFYSTCVLRPYDYLHSYLNIPDTSGRDSLFQAESRRCKQILDKIGQSPATSRHFCMFDELYSGTNPREAVKSARALLHYLAENPTVRFMLTTHYVKLCKSFRKSDKIVNYKMAVRTIAPGQFHYLYKMKPGISKLEGGLAILRNMDYPIEILENVNQYIR